MMALLRLNRPDILTLREMLQAAIEHEQTLLDCYAGTTGFSAEVRRIKARMRRYRALAFHIEVLTTS
jgi:hypothetical protein